MVSPDEDCPSVTLPSSVHNSPDKPLPSSSHDYSATPPQSIHEPTIETTSPTVNKICLSPVVASTDNPSTTPPSIVVESPAAEPLPSSSCDHPNTPSCSTHDIPATPSQSAKDPCRNMQTSPATSDPPQEHTTPLLTSSHDQLQFNDPEIINTQLNYQISEVKNFLKEFP